MMLTLTLDPDQNRAIKPEVLVMAKDLLKIEDFPIHKSLDPQSELDEGWVDTLPGTGLELKKLVALDCEMVKKDLLREYYGFANVYT